MSRTARQAVRDALGSAPSTAKELSALVGLPEKEVYEHLEHLERTLRAEGKRLVVVPPRCLACGFSFRARKRLTRPSRCPACRSERVEAPRFALE